VSQVLTTRRQAQEAEQRVQIRQEESLTGQHGQRTATLVRNWLDEHSRCGRTGWCSGQTYSAAC
jgi:hypothetical protein